MKKIIFNQAFCIVCFLCFTACSRKTMATVDAGVPETLAQNRKQQISNLHYSIGLNIPGDKELPIAGTERITFNWQSNKLPLVIDFKEQKDHLKKVVVNGKAAEPVFINEHLLVAPRLLHKGANEILIDFTAGNLSLNRSDDYLYTLLVPDRARTVFPCFDQPDLKAVFQLSLTIPKEWKALTNAPLHDSLTAGNLKTYHYEPSDVISTYLFSFAAGKFKEVSKVLDGRLMHFYHRETDTAKINRSLDPIFQIQNDALTFLKDYTQIPFPFKKFDFVAIPDFQYGGMEHVGAIQYKASSLFLDNGATKAQELERSNLLSHETAHMWFGDLVTMRWFNDVWMKEVFANFMADKITQVAVANTNFDLKFLLDHFPAAYNIDRTAGANPIRQPLLNLQDAGSLYGNIIYHKAPIVMRQLERLMGKDAFRDGLREYLKTYAYANASWPELIQILARHTTENLNAWNKVWVEEQGRPVISYNLTTQNNIVKSLNISQVGEDGSNRVWPQFFEVLFVYPDHEEEFTVNMNAKEVVVNAVAGKQKPSYIIFNSSGQGYGLFPVDSAMVQQKVTVKNPVVRAAYYINLYENMLNGKVITPLQLIDTYRKNITAEPEELNVRLITGQLSDAFWHFVLPSKRDSLAILLEKDIWTAMQNETVANKKKLYFRTFQSIALSRTAQDSLYRIWTNQKPPEGIKLSEDEYTSIALALAVRDYPDTLILQKQLSRITNPDRQKSLQFIMPALSPDENVRDAFFASLKDEKNREKEAWVTTALQYLHHPLRAATSKKYLKESLDLLEEIQLTGDIFFPQSWLQATFSGYGTTETAAVVRQFLKIHPAYNPKLKAKILQSADILFRSEKLLYPPVF